MSIIVKELNGIVCLELNRPNVLNAINNETIGQLIATVKKYDRDPKVGCFVLHGNSKVFSAGADIKELEEKSWQDMVHLDVFAEWQEFTASRTPIIAAVTGYALGGGCELAMMCDTIYASESAVFGQPEIKLGVIPGMGGSQRLTRLIGRAKAMDMVLTGRTMDALEAHSSGLVARVFTDEELMSEVINIAQTIANYGKTACITAKEAVNRVDEISLSEGILSERRSYHSLWNTKDKEIGMTAFINKQTPVFSNN